MSVLVLCQHKSMPTKAVVCRATIPREANDDHSGPRVCACKCQLCPRCRGRAPGVWRKCTFYFFGFFAFAFSSCLMMPSDRITNRIISIRRAAIKPAKPQKIHCVETGECDKMCAGRTWSKLKARMRQPPLSAHAAATSSCVWNFDLPRK